MSSAKDIAKGFTISGLLDDASRTRKSYPVFEIDLAAIEDHPGNSVYSMDETAIARLTESIRKQGLTDLPLVRKLESGAYQMVSGHRRKAGIHPPCRDRPRIREAAMPRDRGRHRRRVGHAAPCRQLLHAQPHADRARRSNASAWSRG